MKNFNLLKLLSICAISIVVLTAGFVYLRQQPDSILAQWKPNDADKIRIINELAFDSNVGVDTTFKAYNGYYFNELKYYIQNQAQLPSVAAKKFRSSLTDYRINFNDNSKLSKPSEYSCAMSHLDVDTMIECYLIARGMPRESEKYVTRLKRVDSGKYSQITRARDKLNNWAFWVRNNWEPPLIKQIK
jgi:hypothetical protein